MKKLKMDAISIWRTVGREICERELSDTISRAKDLFYVFLKLTISSASADKNS